MGLEAALRQARSKKRKIYEQSQYREISLTIYWNSPKIHYRNDIFSWHGNIELQRQVVGLRESSE